MKQSKKRTAETSAKAAPVYIDEDKKRFEARLRRNVRTKEPRVPPMTAQKGKRTRFTGLTAEGAVAVLKKSQAKKKSQRPVQF
ncbi:MAG: hypothetical protein WDN08_17345 [Rhizomicrobium sp.]